MSNGHVFCDKPFHYTPHTEKGNHHFICIKCYAIYHEDNIDDDSFAPCGKTSYLQERHKAWYLDNIGPLPPLGSNHGFIVTPLF